jgi:hypothetical protein
MPSGVYGDIFDVLVDRPAKAQAIHQYPVVWAAGDARLTGDMLPIVEDYVKKGGTLVVNINQAKDLPVRLTGLGWKGRLRKEDTWFAGKDKKLHAAVPFEVAEIDSSGLQVLVGSNSGPLVVRQAVNQGAVISILVPHGLGLDERAVPFLPALMNALTDDLLPVEVLVDGKRPAGEVMYSFNKTKDGWLVALYNHRGIDKTQNGIARVDRTKAVDVVLRPRLAVASAREMTEPRNLAITKGEIAVHVAAGDVQVIALTAK